MAGNVESACIRPSPVWLRLNLIDEIYLVVKSLALQIYVVRIPTDGRVTHVQYIWQMSEIRSGPAARTISSQAGQVPGRGKRAAH